MSEKLVIKFHGKISDEGKLHFYEYSRSQYATARFISTIEHFRRTGKVPERITRVSYIDILVESPRRGSFIETIIVPAVQQGLSVAVSLPLSTLIAYVWSIFGTRRPAVDSTLTDLAAVRLREKQIQLQIEQERSKQFETLANIAEGGQATTTRAIELVDWALKSGGPAIAAISPERETLLDIRQELGAELDRDRELSNHRATLINLDEERVKRLTSKVRPLVKEMALPIRRSAERMSLTDGNKGRQIAFINEQIAAEIGGKDIEDAETHITGLVRSYDRTTGRGRFSSPELMRPVSFVVTFSDQKRLRDQILEAMRHDEVVLVGQRIIDKDGTPTSLILNDVILPN